MAPRNAKHAVKPKPGALDRSVSFGEDRDGQTRISRPGTSPISPPGRKYPLTSPPLTRAGKTTPEKQKKNKKNLDYATPKHDSHFSFEVPRTPTKIHPRRSPNAFNEIPALPFYTGPPRRASSDHWSSFATEVAPRSPDPASDLVVDIQRLQNGDIEVEFEGVRQSLCHAKKHNTAGGALPSLLQNDNLMHQTQGMFGFRDTNGWQLSGYGRTEENGVEVLGTYGDSALFTPSKKQAKGSKPPSAKAKKNRKAREKKALAKLNAGRREKVPHIPRSMSDGRTRVTRSKARGQFNVFFALP
ncbi:hypothetical protein CERZMDRAFT_95874 [Cercospora zeae-maydis SCOH1-5]|uniref:Uncharacterized protein n=1 Tax=Cercospora zeae-maydis SCOH1-5 TaxID=717836 RepID=A0A6A6FKM8_9PEZI|nr:hypothetical protein CERZMDRAFT_95874 [Cercospora zeae-maydis SCOH1-5]